VEHFAARPQVQERLTKQVAARQGLPAIAACLAEGISVNVTLIFSLTRYDEVIDAFLAGLERARQAGRDLASIASVASFFVSRVDTEVDARLDKIGTAAAGALRGRVAIANARLAYQRYEQMLASPRWAALAAAGARPQRPLWASTSAKDPAYPDTMYVTKLVAPGVVTTMPEATLRAVADHGQIPADSVRDHYQDARQVLSELAAAGVDYDDVTAALEQQATARAMLGQDVSYGKIPYFYTDRYDLGMEYAGYVEPGRYDQVVFRGDVDRREFIAFWLAGGRVLAGMNVNIWDVSDAIQDLVGGGRQVDPARLADPAVPLDEVAG